MPLDTTLSVIAKATEDPVLSSTTPSLNDEKSDAAGWLAETLSLPENSSTAPTQNVAPSSGTSTMGDAIIRGMQSVSDHYAKSTGAFHAALNDDGESLMGLKGALQMHMSFIEVSLEADVVSKVISKSGQHIDQLVKLQ